MDALDTIVCIASGPSLTQDDVDYCRGKAQVYVINTSYKLAPWADVLYACDYAWWKYHDGAKDFIGQKWTYDERAAREYGLNRICGLSNAKFSATPGRIVLGNNSGFQCLNLAALAKPKRIILLGYDMKLAAGGIKHWHGDHPGHMNKQSPYASWLKFFSDAKPLIPCEVINCTVDTALKCFERKPLRETLT